MKPAPVKLIGVGLLICTVMTVVPLTAMLVGLNDLVKVAGLTVMVCPAVLAMMLPLLTTVFQQHRFNERQTTEFEFALARFRMGDTVEVKKDD